MDYSVYSTQPDYKVLVSQFDGLAQVLTNKLKEFKLFGIHPKRMFLFGFSFGGQLSLEAGRRFGPRRIQRIDGKY